MKESFSENILSAVRPSDIFTMNPSTLKTEAETYLSQLKPEAYRTIENFILAQKVKKLFAQAQEDLKLLESGERTSTLRFYSTQGKEFTFQFATAYPSKLGTMYDTPTHVIYSVKPQYKWYFDNYVQKTEAYPKVDRKIWQFVKYMLPKVINHFEEESGNFIIIIEKPSKMYSLRELLEYFGNQMKPEYIASIISRLYYFVSYIALSDLTHNAITVDNLFFAPGRLLEEGEAYTVEDMRIVGVFGGWFFSTYSNEQIKGMPSEIISIAPELVKKTGYSSYEVDELAIKRVARELAGDSTGTDLSHIPEPMRTWITSSTVRENAYEEFHRWKEVEKETFGGYRFIPMDISK